MTDVIGKVLDILKSIFVGLFAFKAGRDSIRTKVVNAKNKVMQKYRKLDKEISKDRTDDEIMNDFYSVDGWSK